MENLSIADSQQGGGLAAQAPAQLPPQMFTTAAQLLDLTDSMDFFLLGPEGGEMLGGGIWK